MSNINLTIRPAMPTADLESLDPELLQFELLSESDGLKRAKINFGSSPRHWSELDFFNPSGGVTIAEVASKQLFAYSNGQSVTSVTEVPITGCSMTVEDDTFYQADILVAVDDLTASPGEISTTGTATFTAVLLRKLYEVNGALSAAEDGRPATFETSGGGNVFTGRLLHFSGTIQTTSAGTIILNALSLNGPGDAFVIDEVRMTLTPIGTV